MRKRNAERAGSKTTAALKRDARRDLSAHKGHGVVGGLLPAVSAGQPGARSGDDMPQEHVAFVYQKIV